MNIILLTLLFIVIDFVTGITKSLYLKQFSSSVMREGLFHKVAFLFAITVGYLIDYAGVYIDLNIGVSIANFMCGYIIVMEIGSTLENLGAMNPDLIPSKIRDAFIKIESSEQKIQDVSNLGDENNDKSD